MSEEPGLFDFYDAPVLSKATAEQAALVTGAGASVGYSVAGTPGIFPGAELGLLAFVAFEVWKEWDYFFGQKGPATNTVHQAKQIEEDLEWWASKLGITLPHGVTNIGRSLAVVTALAQKWNVDINKVAQDYNKWMTEHGFDLKNPETAALQSFAVYEDRQLAQYVTRYFKPLTKGFDKEPVTDPFRLKPPVTNSLEDDLERLASLVRAFWYTRHLDKSAWPRETVEKDRDYQQLYTGYYNQFIKLNRSDQQEFLREFALALGLDAAVGKAGLNRFKNRDKRY